MFNLLIAAIALLSPVLVAIGVVRFIEWRDKRKKTFGGLEVSQQWLDRLHNVKTIKQRSPDGTRELTLGYLKEGF